MNEKEQLVNGIVNEIEEITNKSYHSGSLSVVETVVSTVKKQKRETWTEKEILDMMDALQTYITNIKG